MEYEIHANENRVREKKDRGKMMKRKEKVRNVNKRRELEIK